MRRTLSNATVLLVLSTVLVLAVCSAAPGQEISRAAGSATVEGHWAKKKTSASIACYKRARFCVEARAWVEPATRHVLVMMFDYEVLRWGNDGISAHFDGQDVLTSSDLLISFAADKVTEVSHEKAFGDVTDELQRGSISAEVSCGNEGNQRR